MFIPLGAEGENGGICGQRGSRGGGSYIEPPRLNQHCFPQGTQSYNALRAIDCKFADVGFVVSFFGVLGVKLYFKV